MGNQICGPCEQQVDQNQLTPQEKQIRIRECFLKNIEVVQSEFPKLNIEIAKYKKIIQKEQFNISQQLAEDTYITLYFQILNQKAPLRRPTLSDQSSQQKISQSELLYRKNIHKIQFQSLLKQLNKPKEIQQKIKLQNVYQSMEMIEQDVEEQLIKIFKIFSNRHYFIQHYLRNWLKICRQMDIKDKDTLVQYQKFILQLLFLFLSEIYIDFGLLKEFKCLQSIILKQMLFTLVFNKNFFYSKNLEYFKLFDTMKNVDVQISQINVNEEIIDQIYHVNSPMDKYQALYLGNQQILMNDSVQDQDQRENLLMRFLQNYDRKDVLYYQLDFIEHFKDYFEEVVSANWCIFRVWQVVSNRFVKKQEQ